jgi:hypothetical protein
MGEDSTYEFPVIPTAGKLAGKLATGQQRSGSASATSSESQSERVAIVPHVIQSIGKIKSGSKVAARKKFHQQSMPQITLKSTVNKG